MRFLKFLFLFLLFRGVVQAQNNVQAISHYPVTAYITERLLPFSLVNEDAGEKIRIQSVRLVKGESCHSIIDPFYEKTFHVYCRRPARVRIDVTSVNDRRKTVKITVDEFYVRGKAESASSFSENRKGDP